MRLIREEYPSSISIPENEFILWATRHRSVMLFHLRANLVTCLITTIKPNVRSFSVSNLWKQTDPRYTCKPSNKVTSYWVHTTQWCNYHEDKISLHYGKVTKLTSGTQTDRCLSFFLFFCFSLGLKWSGGHKRGTSCVNKFCYSNRSWETFT